MSILPFQIHLVKEFTYICITAIALNWNVFYNNVEYFSLLWVNNYTDITSNMHTLVSQFLWDVSVFWKLNIKCYFFHSNAHREFPLEDEQYYSSNMIQVVLLVFLTWKSSYFIKKWERKWEIITRVCFGGCCYILLFITLLPLISCIFKFFHCKVDKMSKYIRMLF